MIVTAIDHHRGFVVHGCLENRHGSVFELVIFELL